MGAKNYFFKDFCFLLFEATVHLRYFSKEKKKKQKKKVTKL
jgi:hypothetical protein